MIPNEPTSRNSTAPQPPPERVEPDESTDSAGSQQILSNVEKKIADSAKILSFRQRITQSLSSLQQRISKSIPSLCDLQKRISNIFLSLFCIFSTTTTPIAIPPIASKEENRAYLDPLSTEEMQLFKISPFPQKSCTKRCKAGLTLIDEDDFKLTLRKENLFDSRAKAIVNAANTHLGGGGGIDGAIHTRGGNEYINAHAGLSRHYNRNFSSGHASMIPSGELKTKDGIEYVIAVAGPSCQSEEVDKDKKNALYSCYYNSLVLANEQEIESLAFPAISNGIFKFPIDTAAEIFLRAIYDFRTQYPNSTLKTVSLHAFDADDPRDPQVYTGLSKAFIKSVSF